MTSAADSRSSRTARRPNSSRRNLLTTALVLVAVLWLGSVILFSLANDLLGWDVRFAYLPAGDLILHGHSPYPALDDPILEDQKGYVYPPQLVLFLLPLNALPVDVVAVLVTLVMLALYGLTLWILEVRDVRCYAAGLLWMPIASGVLLANVSIPLALALAVLWKYRDSVWPPAVALGLAVSAKLLFWPLFVWTLATRRLRMTALSIALGIAVTLAAWATIKFAGLTDYPDLLRRLSEIQSANSYSFVGMADTLGLGETVGRIAMLVVGGGLLFLCVVFSRRDDDVRSFTCAVAATLALSPIVWLHYFVALLVPTAILRPRFSAIWLLPLALWASPKPGYPDGVQTFAPAVVAALLLAALLAPGWWRRPIRAAAAAR